ncbi:hypothetical protein BFP72_16160 [Reichenbachiella sp. 5M10]|uniref:M16 family metallopeptidase n=1 Tax=Reichenbachiella sp. 5M10 TaxID=1889772 RepID=UPI000C160D8A|nr:pitrilysin family protein [Reichenbachiella sp. 5M10]PIB36824.1 hypothetical protein BFP72_16160 [Reichenbachiella sp. 5M10]
MLDRTIAPLAGEIAYSPLQEVTEDRTINDIPLYTLDAGVQPVFKLELQLQSGIWYESQRAVSWCTAKMLLEGTPHKSGREISELFDALGAFVEVSAGFDDVSISIYGVNKTFDQVLDLLMEILTESNFPVEAIERLKSIRIDQLKVNDQKNDMLASKRMREAVFGLDHPYGHALQAQEIEAITREIVVDYFEQSLFNQPKIYLSGRIDSVMWRSVQEKFGRLNALQNDGEVFVKKGSHEELFVEREDSLQSSLRVAWDIPAKGSEGYFDYLLANTFLGGYFGSRLMKNIREEKGYTYGISSYPIHLKHASFAVISTDIKAEHTRDTLDEIRREIELLRTKGVSEDEMKSVSNYMAGSFLASISTPFQLMKKFQKVHDLGLDYAYYESYFAALRVVTSEQVQHAMEQYFDMNKPFLSIVGKK